MEAEIRTLIYDHTLLRLEQDAVNKLKQDQVEQESAAHYNSKWGWRPGLASVAQDLGVGSQNPVAVLARLFEQDFRAVVTVDAEVNVWIVPYTSALDIRHLLKAA